jgi:hypothetical protein
MKTLERAILWTGGAVFVGALLYCAYTFVAVWNRPAPFDAPAIWIDAALFAALRGAPQRVRARRGKPARAWFPNGGRRMSG